MRLRSLRVLSCLALSLLSACGGGGGGGSSTPPQTGGSAPAPSPSVSLAMTTAPIDLNVISGESADMTVQGTWTKQNLDAPVYLSVRDAGGRFTLPQPAVATGTAFSMKLSAPSTLAAGTYDGTLELRACKDAACADTWAGTASLAYTMKVAPPEWAMYQGNPAHTGYVPVTLDPARFAKAWEWQRKETSPLGAAINPVVTRNGTVFITGDVYFGQGIVYALSEQDGSETWRYPMGQVPALGPPSVSKGRVYAAVTGQGETTLWAFDAAKGDVLAKSAFEGQLPHVMAPTVSGDMVLTGAGQFGGKTYAFSTSTGASNWVHDAGGVRDMWAPAADDTYVYHHNGAALFMIDRASGATVAQIADPLGTGNTSNGYFGGPVLGSKRDAISFAGGAFSGRASSSQEHYDQCVLSSFDLTQRRYNWSTANPYLTAPALADGVLYAGRNTPSVLDAMDEATGKVLWSWFPPESAETIHRNIIVTRNLLFVSTDRAVYAIDLATRKSVWRYAEPGALALSADRTLYIAVGATSSTGKLVAIRLQK